MPQSYIKASAARPAANKAARTTVVSSFFLRRGTITYRLLQFAVSVPQRIHPMAPALLRALGPFSLPGYRPVPSAFLSCRGHCERVTVASTRQLMISMGKSQKKEKRQCPRKLLIIIVAPLNTTHMQQGITTRPPSTTKLEAMRKPPTMLMPHTGTPRTRESTASMQAARTPRSTVTRPSLSPN